MKAGKYETVERQGRELPADNCKADRVFLFLVPALGVQPPLVTGEAHHQPPGV